MLTEKMIVKLYKIRTHKLNLHDTEILINLLKKALLSPTPKTLIYPNSPSLRKDNSYILIWLCYLRVLFQSYQKKKYKKERTKSTFYAEGEISIKKDNKKCSYKPLLQKKYYHPFRAAEPKQSVLVLFTLHFKCKPQ